MSKANATEKIISDSGRLDISVLIFTKDEEKNIAECIRSVEWADDIYVLDSYSADQTVNIAKECGVNVVQRVFDNYSTNKDWAFKNIPFKNQFLFILDADMRVTDELRDEIHAVFKNPEEVSGYYVPIRNYFNGRWLKHGGWYPNYHLKIFRRDCIRIEHRLVHAHILVDGPVRYLKQDILHLDYKGVEHFIFRHNIYSSMEAVEAYKTLGRGRRWFRLSGDIFIKGPARRRFLKNIAYKLLPARPFFKFFWMYIIKMGFLDGLIGLQYCVLHAFYDYQISLKLNELKDKKSPLYEKYKEYIEK